MAELSFDITVDEEGNYCASARVPDGALLTDAPDMNLLITMLHDLVALYEEDAGCQLDGFVLHFPVNRAA